MTGSVQADARRGGARILVIEDEPGIVQALRTNLSAHGFQVETADAGRAGLKAYKRRRPDLILLDLGLPDMDGKDIVSAVRIEAATPIIILSVRGGEREKVEALDLGADDYLTKPFGVDELLQMKAEIDQFGPIDRAGAQQTPAALGRPAPDEIEAHARAYGEQLAEVEELVLPAEAEYGRHVYHLYVVRVQNRDHVLQGMADRGVACGIHYPIPLHLQEAYRFLNYAIGSFPVAERCADEFLSLPMYPELTTEQIETAARELRALVCTSELSYEPVA